jgi:CubicO group peptidase (beta-lactamase class C family)
MLACSDATGSNNDVDPFPPAPDDTLPYVYTVPEQTGDGWTTGSLAEVGLSESRLTELIDLMRVGTIGNVHGVVIVKDGKLVLEEYFNGQAFQGISGNRIIGPWTEFDRDHIHNLASVTKSITSTLLGIAIDQGLVTGVDTAVYDFFPEYADVRDARKDSITLRHLLTMTSGLEWDESSYSYGDSRNDINALFSQSDPIRYILAKPAVDPPGSIWLYNGGNTNVLGQVVQKVSGLSLHEFADQYLFEPLGITHKSWVMLAGQVTYASGDLRLRPRDMAKIGFLFLNDGAWDGQHVISADWITQATAWSVQTLNPDWGYGYQWWLFHHTANGETYPTFGARGWGGQTITVVPDADMVIVLTGGNYLTSDPVDAIVKHFVLDALID